MSKAWNLLRRFLRDEEGATMVEYALMVALIAIALIASVVLVQQSLSSLFSKVATEMNSAS